MEQDHPHAATNDTDPDNTPATTRSSARVRQRNQQQQQQQQASSSSSATPSASRRRKRSSAPDPSPGVSKHKAATDSEDDQPPRKRARTDKGKNRADEPQQTRYALRARKSSTATTPNMTRKKANSRSKKNKPEEDGVETEADAAAPSTSATVAADETEDVEMADDAEAEAEAEAHSHSGDEGEGDDDDDDEGEGEEIDDHGAAHAMELLGDFRGLGSYMLSLSGRLKTILNNIKPSVDGTTRMVALQELSEILSISTEDMLTGYFQVDAFVKELVSILSGGSGGAVEDDTALESQLLACRCLANLMEALPGSAHTVVYHGAVPVLCAKLIEIAYIDLAEQTLSTLEKMSEEYPSAIVREGGLGALLNYLDFFSTTVQRTALQAASNCMRNVSANSETFAMVRDAFGILRGVLGSYSDTRCVEYACLCVIRAVESYHRAAPEMLETLLDDAQLIRAIHGLLVPSGGGGAVLLSPNTYTLVLRALSTAARASAKTSVALLEGDVVETVYQILTGVVPAQEEEGLALGDMVVMQNIGQRPKEQVEEALGLVCELMPPLPKDGVMDHRAYSEKALAKLVKAKAKAERRAHQPSTSSSSTPAPGPAPAPPASSSSSSAPNPAAVPLPSTSSAASSTTNLAVDEPAPAPAPAPPTRAELLRSRPAVARRFMNLIVPVLVDVFSASVMANVRTKAVTGLLKALCFMDGEEIVRALRNVPIASWAGSVLSSRDRPALVIGALQIVEMLLTKAPGEYRPSFRREGVLHEIEVIADQELVGSSSSTSTAQPSRESQDAVTLRARVVRFKFLQGENDEADDVLVGLKTLVDQLKERESSEEVLRDTVRKVARYFAGASVSGFEFVQSGLVDGLLEFASSEGYRVEPAVRQTMLLDALTAANLDVDANPKAAVAQVSAFATLVKRLQESLTRMESFEVITVSQGADDARRNSASMLARQLRLRLVAEEGSDVPRNCANIVVSIHAIATFQALNDYLRPRVAGVGAIGGSASRLANMLAALASGNLALPTPSGSGSGSRAPPVPAPAPAPVPAAPAQTLGRRRSQRLSEKEKEDDDDAAMADEPEAGADTTHNEDTEMAEAEAEVGPDVTIEEPPRDESEEHEADRSAVLVGEEDAGEDDVAEDFIDADDLAHDVFQESPETRREPEEKTTNVNVADDGRDGLNVTAQTPQGTRVATPNPLAAITRPAPTPSASTQSRLSYAAMLKQRPNDWHLEFSMDDHPLSLPLDMTVYGAIHQHELRKATAAGTQFHPNTIWQGVYTIKFKKVSGPQPPQVQPESADVTMKDRQATPVLTSVPEDAQHAKILRLLRVLYKLNTALTDRHAANTDERLPLPDSAFVNNKLTAKLTRQLEEPMIVASSCLPDWALDLSQHFPFLFPFTTRYAFLQSTSFGYARLILKWQAQQARAQDSRRDDAFAFLGRLQRQKVRISRKHVLESAVKVFELYGSSSSILEVEYFEEVGTGLGPTLEFYSMVSREFARRDLKIWRDADSTVPGPYVHHPLGLFPAPISPSQVSSEAGRRPMQIFRVIGQFIGKALLDSRIIDMSFNKVFMKFILEEDVPLTIATLELVDAALAKSLYKVQAFATAKKAIEADAGLAANAKQAALVNLRINNVALDDLGLDFTVPGYDIELVPNGADVAVTLDNVDEYLASVLDILLGSGIAAQAQAFREGFSKVFPVTDLQIFSADELVVIFGNAEEDWSVDTLNEALKADHGFNAESRAIRDLVNIMSEYDAPARRDYLQFITGSPKLPIGGFRGLNPPFTVVRKPHEPPLSADDYLPSVMTCVNYLKLPEYSSKAVMSTKLRTAMKEGVGSFHLS